MDNVDLVDDVQQLFCLLPCQFHLVVGIELKNQAGQTVVQSDQIGSHNAIEISNYDVVAKVVPADIEDHLFHGKSRLHQVDQHKYCLSGVFPILSCFFTHFALLIKLAMQTDFPQIIVVLDECLLKPCLDCLRTRRFLSLEFFGLWQHDFSIEHPFKIGS